jgi:hypothetical protein
MRQPWRLPRFILRYIRFTLYLQKNAGSSMEDKMIEIARFQQAAEAEMLAGLLQSEGIGCYVRSGLSGSLMFGNDSGGARVELLRKDWLRATEIMKDHGYKALPEIPWQPAPGDPEQEPVDSKRSRDGLSKAMMILILLLVILFGLLVFLDRYFKGAF